MRKSGERATRAALLGAVCLLTVGLVGYGPNQGVTDHHNLTSLTTGDDHTQYLPRSGSRGMTGALTGTSATFTGNLTAVVGHLTTLVLSGVTVTGGSAFFGTQHNTTNGLHTAITATSLVASAGVTAASLDISPTLIRLPTNNGVAVSGGKLNAIVADGLGFDGSKNITPTWAGIPVTADDVTGTAGSLSTFSRGDHKHPVDYGLLANIQDVSEVVSGAGSSSRFSRADHRHVHASIATGDLHPEYIRAAGTRAFSGPQSFGGFQATNLLIENLPTASLPTPSSGDMGRAWFDTTVHAAGYDDGVTNQYLRAVDAGWGCVSSDNRGLRTIDVGAGLGISVSTTAVYIDTNVVPQLGVSNIFGGATNTFKNIVPVSSLAYNLGVASSDYWANLYVVSINGPGGVLQIDSDIALQSKNIYSVGSNSSGTISHPWAASYVSAYYGGGGGAAVFPAGISATSTGGSQGQSVTFTGSSTSTLVTWATAYNNTNYAVSATADTTGVAATWSNKTASSIRINLSSNSGTVHVDCIATPY